jgi:hypothetical protein
MGLALDQIEHEGDALAAFLVERRDTDQNGDAASVLAEILLFEWLQAPTCLQLGDKLVKVAV